MNGIQVVVPVCLQKELRHRLERLLVEGNSTWLLGGQVFGVVHHWCGL